MFREAGATRGFVLLENPVSGAHVSPGFHATGCANVFEAALEWRLLASDGSVIESGSGQASCGTGCVGDFDIQVEFEAPGAPAAAVLEVYAPSPRDGEPLYVNSVPLILQ